jgi:hypothetical protein
MIKISKLFDVRYGVNLELNALVKDSAGVNFVSRTAKNNGVSAKVRMIPDLDPIEAGVLTVAGGGSVLETFLQPEPFYSGRDLYYLKPLVFMNDLQKLFYCACIRANKYRYNYGRQANRTLKDIMVPSPEEIPSWINNYDPDMYDGADAPAIESESSQHNVEQWQPFILSSLFDIKKGKRLTKANMMNGDTPYIGAIDSNNGISSVIGQRPIHKGNTISVTYNGSVAEAFYQPVPFWATDDVNVLYPRFKMTPAIALFIATVIRQEKYRFNYGRKWHLGRMKTSVIKLPVTDAGAPDWDFMGKYIQSLPYSSRIE